MAEELDIDTIFKLKVDGLKRELEKRKLPKSGTKSELQERLLNHLTTHDIAAITNKGEPLDDTTEDEELNQEIEASLDKIDTPTVLSEEGQKFLGEEDAETPVVNEKEEEKKEELVENPITESTQVNTNVEEKEQPIQKKEVSPSVKKISLTESEKIEQRSKRFGTTVSETEKKKSRLERFGSDSHKTTTNVGDGDKLAQRSARFGSSKTTNSKTITSTDSSIPNASKLKERQERFVDAKIKKRQERFGVIQSTNPSNDLEARKRQRALKFGVK